MAGTCVQDQLDLGGMHATYKLMSESYFWRHFQQYAMKIMPASSSGKRLVAGDLVAKTSCWMSYHSNRIGHIVSQGADHQKHAICFQMWRSRVSIYGHLHHIEINKNPPMLYFHLCWSEPVHRYWTPHHVALCKPPCKELECMHSTVCIDTCTSMIGTAIQ